VRSVLTGGRLIGLDGSCWVFRGLPTLHVDDHATLRASVGEGNPLYRLLEGLAGQSETGDTQRNVNAYRRLHLLVLPGAGYVAVGVELRPIVSRRGKGPMTAALDSLAGGLAGGHTPLLDYDEDYRSVDATMRETGIGELSPSQMRQVLSWWEADGQFETHMVIHADHIHRFRSSTSASIAAGRNACDCPAWDIPGSSTLTMALVTEIDKNWLYSASDQPHWMNDLRDAGAQAVSIRGRVEPSALTLAHRDRERSRRMRPGRDNAGRKVTQVPAIGEQNGATLIDVSVVAGIDHMEGDPAALVTTGSCHLSALAFAQQSALAETMACSPYRCTPLRSEIPARIIASAAILLDRPCDTDLAIRRPVPLTLAEAA